MNAAANKPGRKAGTKIFSVNTYIDEAGVERSSLKSGEKKSWDALIACFRSKVEENLNRPSPGAKVVEVDADTAKVFKAELPKVYKALGGEMTVSNAATAMKLGGMRKDLSDIKRQLSAWLRLGEGGFKLPEGRGGPDPKIEKA